MDVQLPVLPLRHRRAQPLVSDAPHLRVADPRVVRLPLKAAHHHELGSPFHLLRPFANAHAEPLRHPALPLVEVGIEDALQRPLGHAPPVGQLLGEEVEPVSKAAREPRVARRVEQPESGTLWTP